MREYIITMTTVENPNTTYIFNGYYRGFPKWQSVWTYSESGKRYKTLKALMNSINKLKMMIPDSTIAVMEVNEYSLGAELHIYYDNDDTTEIRYFNNKKDAEKYCEENGVANYEIFSQSKIV